MTRSPIVTRLQALRAIRAELSPELARLLDTAPQYVRTAVAAMILEGGASPKGAAEAFTVACELADANETGELTDAQGLALMAKLAHRQLGSVKPD